MIVQVAGSIIATNAYRTESQPPERITRCVAAAARRLCDLRIRGFFAFERKTDNLSSQSNPFDFSP